MCLQLLRVITAGFIMHTELPEFKRCCFCVPLRYGLLTWGYLKLISSGFLLIMFIGALKYAINRALSATVAMHYCEEIVVYSIVILLLTIDATLTTVFLVGGHQKSAKLLRVYYIYGMVLLVLLFIMLAFLLLPFFYESTYITYRMRVYLIDACSIFFEIILQIYFLLLVRSEMVKLNSNCEFRFVNNAVQAECVMTCKENEDEKVTEELKREDCV